MKRILFILLLTSLCSCSPKVITNSLNQHTSSRIALDYEPFAIIEKDTIDRSIYSVLGKIEIKDNGLSLNCDYNSIKKIAKSEALKLGGNCFVITEHKPPSTWSTCHRIKADVFLIENVRAFEKEIIWNQNRKLTILDFKGSVEKRPFTAATASSFRYNIEGRAAFPNRFKLFVETFFDCYHSYFKRTDYDAAVLDHEQVHFDISELYSRIFMEKVDSGISNLNVFLAKQDSLLDLVGREMQLKQDEYDTEVYADRAQQIKWNNWIKDELSKYEKYANKTLVINKEKKRQ